MEENFDITDDAKKLYEERRAELAKIIEALVSLDKSKEWQVLKELVFEKSLTAIERQMLMETKQPKINTDKLYRLQGEWAWATQYNDVKRFANSLKLQLEEINKKLK